MTRRSYSGNNQPTTLAGSILSGDTTLTLLDGSNLPSGIAGPFVLTLEAGNARRRRSRSLPARATSARALSGASTGRRRLLTLQGRACGTRSVPSIWTRRTRT